MIASVKGQVEHVESDLVVIDVGGVGVQVSVPSYVSQELRPGEAVYLHTYLVVREDSLTLYGFDTMDARDVFGVLLGVNGVGPRLALAILSTLTPDAIRRAVFQEQAEVFSRVPGVGNKTAQKILLHLQDRLPLREGMELETAISDMDTEVLNALTVLGYSVVEAQAALQMIPRDAPQDVETRLRLALQYFTRP
jgi:Holliday junction DNA helicase RuvA